MHISALDGQHRSRFDIHTAEISVHEFTEYIDFIIKTATVQNTYSILSQTNASVAVVVSGNTHNVTYYVPTIERGKHPMAINTHNSI